MGNLCFPPSPLQELLALPSASLPQIIPMVWTASACFLTLRQGEAVAPVSPWTLFHALATVIFWSSVFCAFKFPQKFTVVFQNIILVGFVHVAISNRFNLSLQQREKQIRFTEFQVHFNYHFNPHCFISFTASNSSMISMRGNPGKDCWLLASSKALA